MLSVAEITSLHAEILSVAEMAISAKDSSFCAKFVRYNIFTNGPHTSQMAAAASHKQRVARWACLDRLHQ